MTGHGCWTLQILTWGTGRPISSHGWEWSRGSHVCQVSQGSGLPCLLRQPLPLPAVGPSSVACDLLPNDLELLMSSETENTAGPKPHTGLWPRSAPCGATDSVPHLCQVEGQSCLKSQGDWAMLLTPESFSWHSVATCSSVTAVIS
jgi:hypothetical protein